MSAIYDINSNKKNINLTINSDLLRQAKALGINLSGTLEKELIALVRAHRRAQWRAENAEAISDCNARIERRGAFSDGTRRF